MMQILRCWAGGVIEENEKGYQSKGNAQNIPLFLRPNSL